MAFSNTLVLCFFLTITMALPILATVHVVGDALGWTVDSDYTIWISDKSFVVGDSLVFNYDDGWHTVDEVDESDYKSCIATNSISTDNSGATIIPLQKAGTHYFICAVPIHCTSGMKLSVKVKPSSGSPAPSATPSSGKGSPSNGTPDTITTAPSTTAITTPTMQNVSSTTSLSPIVDLFFVVILISYILV